MKKITIEQVDAMMKEWFSGKDATKSDNAWKELLKNIS